MQTLVPVDHPEHLTMYFDGSLNLNGIGMGVYFISPSGDKLCYVLHIHFRASNNTVEYEAALHNLHIAIELGVKRLMVYGDSALMTNQLNKDWNSTNEKMDAYCVAIKNSKTGSTESNTILWFRADNQAADELSKLGSTRAKVLAGVFVQDLVTPSIK